jgi:hypothetical protein
MYKEISCFYICLSIGQTESIVTKVIDPTDLESEKVHNNAEMTDIVYCQYCVITFESSNYHCCKCKNEFLKKDNHLCV